ncbi:preprotein translocase subunit SecY [Candidatus Parcubacteria bacterium]|nr:preprotein translocase subunit SecY [Candidatus Parcubacteria bacterium]
MLKNFLALFRSPDLRKKILIVLALLAVFRIMAAIPLPDVNPEKLRAFFQANQFFGLFNIFTGGAFNNISIVMLGVGPYITASIIMQLLTMVFPNLKEFFYEGTDKERALFEQYTRLATIPLASLQAFAFLNLLKSQGIISFSSPLNLIRDVILATAASFFLMWLGELMTEQKIGNGISFIIFTGIVISLPKEIAQTIISTDPTRIPNMIAFFVVSLLIIIGVVFISQGQRKIPVSYAKQVRGTKIYGGADTYLPLRVNQAGMIPIIFAISILMFPQMIGNFLSASHNATLLRIALTLKNFNSTSWLYLIIYFALVCLFTFFYTSITFEPESIADNLQKRGGFIPGYRPGQTTTNFLSNTSRRITLFGAIFLGLIAILPIILAKATGITTMAISGASILIMVTVAIETIEALEAQLIMREYEIS